MDAASVERAEAALKQAKADESRHLAAVALNEAAADANPVKAAEYKLAEAKAALDAIRKTRAALEDEMASTKENLGYATAALDKAVSDVIRAETPIAVSALLKDAQSMQAKLIGKRVTLRHLLHNDLINEPEKQPSCRPTA